MQKQVKFNSAGIYGKIEEKKGHYAWFKLFNTKEKLYLN